MSIPNETLMAYVDDELEPPARAEVEAAIRDDPEIARLVAQFRDLRVRIQSAYLTELAEPVPERLLAVLGQSTRTAGTKVVDLANARDSVARKAARTQPSRSRWRYVTSIAASLLVVVSAGYVVWHRSQSVMVKDVGGSLVARGPLAVGLSNQLGGDVAPSSTVNIGLSFLAKSGEYCRIFSISGGASGSGLACRQANQWQIRVLTQPVPGAGRDSEYRTASSSLPPAILAAVQDQIAGDPLDRAAEIAAREQGWRSAGKSPAH
jgi:hypothetical protein